MSEKTTSGPQRRTLLLVVAAVMALSAGAALVLSRGGQEPREARRDPPTPLPAPRDLAAAVAVPGMLEHMRALERAAAGNGGNRAAGTRGDRASIGYVAGRLRRAGWRVTLERVRFPFFAMRSPERLTAAGRRLDAAALRFSGSGSAVGPARAVGSGCLAAEYRGFPRGSVAVARRGSCFLRQTVRVAQAAGAAAVAIFDPDTAGAPLAGTLISPAGVRIPALSVSRADGRRLIRAGARVRVRVNAVSEHRRTANVIAELGREGKVAMAGGHLDSVPEGPGVNDNGSGVATLLEIAEQIGASPTRPRRRMRLAFWGAEEVGLHGSRHHVRRLPRSERRAIAAYLNLDMVGSANGGRFLYGGRRGAAAAALRAAKRHLRRRGVRLERVGAGASSDHAPFEDAGVPVLGLYSGGPEEKDRGQRHAWGGRAGEPFDACYHRRCDSLGRVNRRALSELSDGAAVAFHRLAF